MIATVPIERVAAILQTGSFKRLVPPLNIAGVKVDVPAAFVGTGKSPDLVIVGDTAFDTPKRLLQTIDSIGRALDIAESRRPLTLVVVGPRPGPEFLRAMTRFARVLPVGDDSDEASLRNWLAALLPLALPPAETERSLATNSEMTVRAGTLFAQELRGASVSSKDAVSKLLHAAIEAPFEAPHTEPPEKPDT